jgi:hypothetical protein
MKKISLAIIAASLFAVPTNAESNFDGFRATIGGSYAWNFASSSLTSPFKNTKIDAVAASGTTAAVIGQTNEAPVVTPLPNAFGKAWLDVGYAKVMSSNLLAGISAVVGWDNLTIDDKSGTAVAETKDSAGNPTPSKPTQLATDQKFTGGLLGGLKVQAGFVVTPKIAIKLIGEGTYEKFTWAFKDTAKTDQTATVWAMGAAVGGAVDFAATDRIIISLGAKYKFAPTDITFVAKDNDKALGTTDAKFTFNNSGIEIFAELGFRITQN